MRGTSVVSNLSVTAAKLNFVLEGMAGCISALSHKDKLMAQAITLSPDPAPVRTNNPRVNKLIENNKPAYVSVKRPCPPVEEDENSLLWKNYGGVSEKKMDTLAWKKIDVPGLNLLLDN
jgi:hypothetical protein